MKSSVASIPLSLFAGLASGLVGALFFVAPLSVLPPVVHDHGWWSVVTLMDLLAAGVGGLVIALSVGVGFRRRWAQRALVRSLLALLLVLAFALGRKLLQSGTTLSDRVKDLTLGPCVMLGIGVVVLFLLNRHVQEELQPQPVEPAAPPRLTGV